MSFEVLLTADAERDLEELYDYVRRYDSHAAADHVLDRLLAVADSLAAEPQRGSIPKELRELGLQDFRQVLFKPYRVIYRVSGSQVLVLVIADGRREMSTLLQRRLLGG